jgi:4'-phosphopantetheinyl transferase
MKWYKYDIRDLTDAEYQKWYRQMSKEKQNQVDKLRLEADKKRTVAGEMLARKAVAEYSGVKAEDIIFAISESGKPYIENSKFEFNISHSGDYAVCAVNETPIGIDIEKLRPVDLRVAKRVCNEAELIYLFGFPPKENEFVYTEDKELITRFFEIWTAKEAYVKLTGQGIDGDFSEFCIFDLDEYLYQTKIDGCSFSLCSPDICDVEIIDRR